MSTPTAKSALVLRMLEHHRPDHLLLSTRGAVEFSVNCVAFSPDGKLLATGSRDGLAALVDSATGKVRHKVRHRTEGAKAVCCVSFSPDGNRWTVGSRHSAAVVDTATGKVMQKLGHHTCRSNFMSPKAYSLDGKLLAEVLDQGESLVRHTAAGAVRHTLTHHTRWVSCVAFSPCGTLLATGSHDRTAALVDVASGEVLHRFKPHPTEVSCIAFSPDGKLLATGSGSDYAVALVWLGGSFWTLDLHRHLPRPAREIVATVMLCAGRIARGAREPAAGDDNAGCHDDVISRTLPPLPVELWLMILGFARADALLRLARRRLLLGKW